MKIHKLTPRNHNESIEEYLSRIFTTEKEVIEYWKQLTKEIYKENPTLVEKTLDIIHDINPEAHKIVSDTYIELKQGSN